MQFEPIRRVSSEEDFQPLLVWTSQLRKSPAHLQLVHLLRMAASLRSPQEQTEDGAALQRMSLSWVLSPPPPTPPRGLCCRNGILHRAGAQGTVLLNWIDLSSLLKGPAWMFWNGFNSLPLLGLLRNFCCSHSRFSNNGFKTQGTLMRSYNPYTSPLLYHRGVLPSRLSTCVFRVCRSQPFHGNEPFHTRGFLPSHCPQPDEWRPFSGSLCIATQMWERVFSWTYELKENFQVLFKLNQWLRHSLYTVNVTLFNVWFCPPAFTVM